MSEEAIREQVEAAEESLEAAVARLAQLSRLEYDKCRKSESETLGVRLSTLDTEVEGARPMLDAPKGLDEESPDGVNKIIDPWPGLVDGADLIAGIISETRRYAILPAGCAEIVAAWCIHTHCYEAWRLTPRLNIGAPERECGKSVLLDVIDQLVPRPLKSESVSTASLFRMIETFKPTLLLDEADHQLKKNDDLLACLNAGHKRGGKHWRCKPDTNEPESFNTFAPAAIAGIGKLTPTLASRSIRINMKRKKDSERVENFEEHLATGLHELASKAARWTEDNLSQLRAARPAMPDGVYNRIADNWRPLLSIADVVGGEWPERLREAAIRMNAVEREDKSHGEKLLEDIRAIFQRSGQDRLSSENIVNALVEMDDRPWPEWYRGQPMSKPALARQLTRYGIQSTTLRLPGAPNAKGYYRRAFTEAFECYLSPTPISTVTPLQSTDSAGSGGNGTVTPENDVTVGKSLEGTDSAGCNDVTDETVGNGSDGEWEVIL